MNPASLIGHAIELLKLIDGSNQPADKVVSGFFHERRYLGSKDRRWISETLFGMIRHRRYIEALLEQYLIEYPAHQDLNDRQSRYLSLYAAYAASGPAANSTDVSSSLWKTTFPAIELPSFLERIRQHQALDFLEDDEVVRLGVKHSFQDWMVNEWLEQFEGECEPLLHALNRPANIALRVNGGKASREDCRTRLNSEGIDTALTKLAPAGLVASKRFNVQTISAFADGWFEMQDEGSQIVSLLAHPQPGSVVIDACAGAGGKSLHLAELMKDEGELIAIDVDAGRLRELERRAARAGIHCVKPLLAGDVQPENFFSKADLVLVDAPCSGVGTIRRNPAFKWSVTEDIVNHYATMQSAILNDSSRYVRQGGRLVYVTCSLLRKENEEVVDKFLAGHPGFQSVVADDAVAPYGLVVKNGCVKLLPHLHDTDGFAVFILRRIS